MKGDLKTVNTDKKLRVGVVGLGHRGRFMFKLAADSFDFVVPAAACDIKPVNWYEKQWLMDEAMAITFPDTEFYEDYDEMLEKANKDEIPSYIVDIINEKLGNSEKMDDNIIEIDGEKYIKIED